MKIAIVHDQLLEFGGSERVLIALMGIFPEAQIFTSFFSPEQLGSQAKKFLKREIQTSWADKISIIKNNQKYLKIIYPYIWESFDFSGYNLVISSSGSYSSKAIITGPETMHICYLHHPPRYLYDFATNINYRRNILFKGYVSMISHGLRIFDFISSQKVDYFIANSRYTQKNIKRFYQRESVVIYPPVAGFYRKSKRHIIKKGIDYFITVSRFAGNKNLEVLINAARELPFKLIIVCGGHSYRELKKMTNANIGILTGIDDDQLTELLSNAKAYLSSAVDEDFGISVAEALSFGIPVIAYQSGGLPEFIKNGINGYLFDSLDSQSLLEKIKLLNTLDIKEYRKMKTKALDSSINFSGQRFRKEFLAYLEIVQKKKKVIYG